MTAVDPKPTVASEGELQAVIYRLVNEVKAASDARGCRREPFFRPVTLVRQEQGVKRRYSCFSRDISPTGLGLIHNMCIEPSETVLVVFDGEDPVLLRGRVVWSRSCGEGWHISGVEFLIGEHAG